MQSKENFVNPQFQIHRKRNSRLNALLQRNSKPTLCLQHRYIYIQHKYTEMIAINGIRQPIRERLKPSINKTSEHNSSIHYVNHLLFFNVFISCIFFFEFQAFHIFFFIIESSKGYFIFLISVFAIFKY